MTSTGKLGFKELEENTVQSISGILIIHTGEFGTAAGIFISLWRLIGY